MPKKGEVKPIKHGTNGGAQAHRKRGIPYCDPCRLEKNKYEQKLRDKKKKEAQLREEPELIRKRALARMARENPFLYKRALYIEQTKRSAELAEAQKPLPSELT